MVKLFLNDFILIHTIFQILRPLKTWGFAMAFSSSSVNGDLNFHRRGRKRKLCINSVIFLLVNQQIEEECYFWLMPSFMILYYTLSSLEGLKNCPVTTFSSFYPSKTNRGNYLTHIYHPKWFHS